MGSTVGRALAGDTLGLFYNAHAFVTDSSALAVPVVETFYTLVDCHITKKADAVGIGLAPIFCSAHTIAAAQLSLVAVTIHETFHTLPSGKVTL